MLPLIARQSPPLILCGRSETALSDLVAAAYDAQSAAGPGDWPLDGAGGAALHRHDGAFRLNAPRAGRNLPRLRRSEASWPLHLTTALRDAPAGQPVLGLILPAKGDDPEDRAFLARFLDDLAPHAPALRQVLVVLTGALPFLELAPVPFDQVDAWERAQAGLWDGETPWQKAARPDAWQGALTTMDRSWGGRLDGLMQRLGALNLGADVLPICVTGFDRATGGAAGDSTPAARRSPLNLKPLIRLLTGQARFPQAMLPA